MPPPHRSNTGVSQPTTAANADYPLLDDLEELARRGQGGLLHPNLYGTETGTLNELSRDVPLGSNDGVVDTGSGDSTDPGATMLQSQPMPSAMRGTRSLRSTNVS